MIRTITILASIFLSSAVFSGEVSSGSLKVSPILMSEITPDCSCSFHMPANKKGDGDMLIFWAFSEEATMRINDNLIKLNNVNEKISLELGGNTKFFFEKDKLKVSGNCKTTWVCPENSTSCEVTEYEGKLEVFDGKNKLSIPVWGSCGC